MKSVFLHYHIAGAKEWRSRFFGSGPGGHSYGKVLKRPQGPPRTGSGFQAYPLPLGPECGETSVPFLTLDQHWMLLVSLLPVGTCPLHENLE